MHFSQDITKETRFILNHAKPKQFEAIEFRGQNLFKPKETHNLVSLKASKPLFSYPNGKIQQSLKIFYAFIMLYSSFN